jgi:hypothetical protein
LHQQTPTEISFTPTNILRTPRGANSPLTETWASHNTHNDDNDDYDGDDYDGDDDDSDDDDSDDGDYDDYDGDDDNYDDYDDDCDDGDEDDESHCRYQLSGGLLIHVPVVYSSLSS